MTTAEAIRKQIKEIGVGEPFTSTQFKGLGTRASVDQTLSRLVKQGEMVRVSRGSRELKLGKLQLILKHVAPRKLALSGRPSGLALSALWYLGKKQVSPRTIKTIQEKLAPEAFEELKAETRSMPAWMADTLHRYEKEATGA